MPPVETPAPYSPPIRCDKSWIHTWSGRTFWPLSPATADVEARDITVALSRRARFSGMTVNFYSVAQHSVEVSRRAGTEEMAKWGLLHDAAEAYLPDFVRPLKRLFPTFYQVEDHLLSVIGARFGLALPLPPEVVVADDRMCMTELRDLFGDRESGYRMAGVEPYEDRLNPDTWPPDFAAGQFQAEFRRLFGPSYW